MPRPRRVHRLLARLLLALAPLRPRMAGLGPAIALGATLAACMSPMTPAAKLNETVQETNMALRFGTFQLSLNHTLRIFEGDGSSTGEVHLPGIFSLGARYVIGHAVDLSASVYNLDGNGVGASLYCEVRGQSCSKLESEVQRSGQ